MALRYPNTERLLAEQISQYSSQQQRGLEMLGQGQLQSQGMAGRLMSGFDDQRVSSNPFDSSYGGHVRMGDPRGNVLDRVSFERAHWIKRTYELELKCKSHERVHKDFNNHGYIVNAYIINKAPQSDPVPDIGVEGEIKTIRQQLQRKTNKWLNGRI